MSRRAPRRGAAAAPRLAVRRALRPPQERRGCTARAAQRHPGQLGGVLPRGHLHRKPGTAEVSPGAFVTAVRVRAVRWCRPWCAARAARCRPPAAAVPGSASSSRSCRRSRRRPSADAHAVPQLRDRGARRRSSPRSGSPTSHVATILTAHLIQRMRDLPQRADLDALHELGEHVAAAGGDLLQARRAPAAERSALRAWKARTAGDLRLLLLLGRADQLRTLVLLGAHRLRTGRC